MAKFPGIRVESDIQAWAYLEEFATGVEQYRLIANPTGADERWVGVCYFQLIEDEKALLHFRKAVAKGEEAARINLAHLLRFLERGDEGAQELRSVNHAVLNEYDQVFYYRLVSLHEENNGNLREGLKAVEEAWRRVQRIPEYAILAPSILAQLGTLHSRIGRAQRALWFLERALQITDGVEHLKTRLRRAQVLQTLGRHNEASAELQSLSSLDLPKLFEPELFYYLGELAWAARDTDGAEVALKKAISLARSLQLPFEEFVASLSLVGIELLRGNHEAAKTYLSRAQALVLDKSDRLKYRFREIHFMWASGTYSQEHAQAELMLLDEDFEEMGLFQEQAHVKLHRAGLLERIGSPLVVPVLDELQALTVTLQSNSFLTREWVAFPNLQTLARRTHPDLVGRAGVVLEVRTLGEEALFVGRERVHIPLKRAVELLAYLLEHKAVSLEVLLDEVFPGQKSRSAKSYFHQVRHHLKKGIDGLEIEYDQDAKLYRLTSEIDIVWDVAELRAGRKVKNVGPFLPNSGNDWALMVDHALERYRSLAA